MCGRVLAESFSLHVKISHCNIIVTASFRQERITSTDLALLWGQIDSPAASTVNNLCLIDSADRTRVGEAGDLQSQGLTHELAAEDAKRGSSKFGSDISQSDDDNNNLDSDKASGPQAASGRLNQKGRGVSAPERPKDKKASRKSYLQAF